MSIDIHVPRPVSEAAEKLAEHLGITVSELYTAAVTSYVSRHQKDGVTELLDRVYDVEPSNMDPQLVTLQIASVGDEAW
jgi:hypothetical protein